MSCGMEPIKEVGGSGVCLPHPTYIPPWDNYFYIEHWSYIILSWISP